MAAWSYFRGAGTDERVSSERVPGPAVMTSSDQRAAQPLPTPSGVVPGSYWV